MGLLIPLQGKFIAALVGSMLLSQAGGEAKQPVHFVDPATGITLTYPASWDRKLGTLPDYDPGLGYLGLLPMSFGSSGGRRIVTLRMPGAAHKGTDFVSAYITISMDRSTPETCHAFGSDITGARTLHKKIDGTEFEGIVEQGAASMHQSDERTLHGHRQGVCHEIGYGLATGGYGAVDGLKRVYRKGVFRRLQRVVDSIRF